MLGTDLEHGKADKHLGWDVVHARGSGRSGNYSGRQIP